MSESLALVTAADTTFFPLLRGLLQSIQDTGHNERAALCVIDVSSPTRR
jgi:hypothetical protein